MNFIWSVVVLNHRGFSGRQSTVLACVALFACLSLLAPASSLAEVLELEGTVKAVDASARSITIERKTPKGTKTLELEVTKKAGDLGSVKAGDSISFSYDPDLELVTKLGGGGGDGETPATQKACLWTIAVSDTGDVAVSIDGTAVGQPPRPEQQAMSRKKTGNGAWDCSYYFSSPDVLNAFDFVKGVSVNKQTATARMMPPSKGEMASMSLRGRIHVPFSISGETLESAQDGGFGVNVIGGSGTSTHHHFTVQLQSINPEGETAKLAFFVRELNVATKQWSKTETVFDESIDFAKPWKKSFRLPVANRRQDAMYDVAFAAGVGPVELRRISFMGMCSPLFRMQLDEQDGAVFAKHVFPEGAALRAGLKDGDVVLSINGRKPASASEAVKLLADSGFDEECVLNIERGNEKKTFTMMERWDRHALQASTPQPRGGLGERLKGTKWINDNKATFEWTADGRLRHNSKYPEWRVLDEQRVEITFDPKKKVILTFDEDLTRFDQPLGDGKKFVGRRTDR